MRTCKIDSDKRRIQFRDFVLVDKKLSTVRGYICALSAESLVGTLSQELFKTRDVFDITDEKQLMLLYSKLLKHPQNKNSHSRFTAALNYYIKFVNLE